MLLPPQLLEPCFQLIRDPCRQVRIVFVSMFSVQHLAASKTYLNPCSHAGLIKRSNIETRLDCPGLAWLDGNLSSRPKDCFHLIYRHLLLLLLLPQFEVVAIGHTLITVGKYLWQDKHGRDYCCHKCSQHQPGLFRRLPHGDILFPPTFRVFGVFRGFLMGSHPCPSQTV
jgi:hypothetical protein